MDKDILRLALIGMGITLIVGIYLWDRFQKKRVDRNDLHSTRKSDSERIKAETARQHHQSDSGDIPLEPFGPALRDEAIHLNHDVVHFTARDNDLGDDPASEGPIVNQPLKVPLPEIVQFAVVARNNNHFKGVEIFRALADLEMQHGDMDIFHRYDKKNGGIQLSAATLVEPGTFPIDNIGTFETPGLALFFQPSEVFEPIASFDTLVQTCRTLASVLGGEVFDGQKNHLTDDAIHEIRQTLRNRKS